VAPPRVPAVGDEAGPVVAAAGAAGEVVTSAALTISGEVVIVLLWMRRSWMERLYAYVTVAYYTVG
jgi:hypothetical protein